LAVTKSEAVSEQSLSAVTEIVPTRIACLRP